MTTTRADALFSKGLSCCGIFSQIHTNVLVVVMGTIIVFFIQTKLNGESRLLSDTAIQYHSMCNHDACILTIMHTSLERNVPNLIVA